MRKLAAALLLVALGRLASPAAVPVYDGVGAPDEPYKYVGRSNAPAASVSTTVPASRRSSVALTLRSAEKGPQVVLDLAADGFDVTTPTLTITATPLAADGTQVPQGTIDGNAYRITATPGARLRPDRAQGFLYLRAAVMTRPDPVIVHRASPTSAWTAAKTTRAGQDILATPFRATGDYAVVSLPGAKPLSQSGGLSGTRLLVLVGGVLLLVVLTILVLRRPGPGGE